MIYCILIDEALIFDMHNAAIELTNISKRRIIYNDVIIPQSLKNDFSFTECQ
jgi:rRNA-processing protein FCF1